MNALKHVDSHMDDLISDLQKLIQQPSVSAKNEGIEECAKLVKTLLKSSGLKSEILRLKKGIAPIVFAEIKSKKNPDKTLMFYNHYDVQPAEPFDLWDDPPFSGIRKGNKIFGRGSTDDKGELITREESDRRSIFNEFLGNLYFFSLNKAHPKESIIYPSFGLN